MSSQHKPIMWPILLQPPTSLLQSILPCGLPFLLFLPLYGLCGRAQCSQQLGAGPCDYTCIHTAPRAQVTQDSCSDGFHQQPLCGLQL